MSGFQTSDKKQHTPSPRDLLFKYLPYLPWIILSLLIALGIAWMKLRYSTPIYSVAGKILVKEENPYGNGAEKFSNIFGMPDDNTNLNNEVEIIKSRSMASRVGKYLGFQQRFSIKGKILTSEVQSSEIPFEWHINEIGDSVRPVSFLITILNNNQYTINEESALYNFGQIVQHSLVKFRLIPSRNIIIKNDPLQFVIEWKPLDDIAAELAENINVTQQEGASVLNISYQGPNSNIGGDIVNAYMKEYQQSSLEDKKLIAFNTLLFIDDQLDTLQRELGGVERNLQNFREENRVFNPEAQATEALAQISESQKIITEQGVKIKIVDYLKNYIANEENRNKIVPSNLGIEEPSLVEQITSYNQLQLKKETALRTTTAENPLVKSAETSIEKLRNDIVENLNNIRSAYQLSYNEIESLSRAADKNVRTIPGKEKILLEVTRRQSILQELYSFLLQKKLETAISSASTISDIKILEPAIANPYPIKPNRKGAYTIALFFGLALPIGVIFLLDYLNDKINSRSDIEKNTSTPILGEVGHADDANALVVKKNNRSFVAEQFRIIRSNLQFILPKNEKPVILVTSTFSGEGKSFISTNLGAVLALSGKKTVILEMDIRKPKILKGLGMNERKGITNYLVSDLSVDEVIYAVPDFDDLFVIPCGPVPPNPAELLLDERISELFVSLRRKFDAIIIDSAPVGLVSDAISLSAHANSAVYIVRHSYTLKRQINLIEEIYSNKKLPNLSIIINDIDTKGRHGGYYGYGYGYGAYGYGNLKRKSNSDAYFSDQS